MIADAEHAERRDAAERLATFLMGMRARGIRDTALLSAVERAPRELFLPRELHAFAYEPVELPIGCGQSAPACGEMLERLAHLRIHARDAVLEVGAGSGYQTALLALCARRVVTTERFRTLSLEAARRLQQLGLGNASVRQGDGLEGVAAHGHYDLIVLNGGVEQLPPPLLDLLSPQGGRMLAAVGATGALRLRLLERERTGDRDIDLGPIATLMLRRGTAGVL